MTKDTNWLVNFYIEDPDFNDFLSMFEEEEMKTVKCSICGKDIEVRKSFDTEGYVCTICADEAIRDYVERHA